MNLVFALLLDAVFGEPKQIWDRFPHPAVLMGRIISYLELRLNKGDNRRVKGVLVILGLLFGAAFLGGVLALFGPIVEILVAAILLAHKSLVDHVAQVSKALRIGLSEGREAVAHIVGRDVSVLDETGVARAAIESGAENFSDGVVAPAFWMVLFGLPGLLVYKTLNTADSMIGYKTERYGEFGWAAARLDDVANWIPARLSAALIAVCLGRPDARHVIFRDAGLHRSPNAGWPEAAMAASLDIALSGPRSYHGEMRDEPYVHPEGGRELGPTDIDAAVAALWKAWVGLVIIVGVIAIL